MENLLEILGKIGFDWQVALANLFNFLIIFLILRKFAFGPIGKLIKERQEAIDQGLKNAETNSKLLESTKKEYEAVLLDARTKANEIIEQAKKEAGLKKDQLVDQTKIEIASMLENGKKSLEVEKNKMLNETKQEIVGLVLQVTEKVIGIKADQSYSDRVTKELSNLSNG
jgi:F-type H+-transporting ATPase subunit b